MKRVPCTAPSQQPQRILTTFEKNFELGVMNRRKICGVMHQTFLN